jgi:photosystem II stability/assembly factor-like uncharacterized protein
MKKFIFTFLSILILSNCSIAQWVLQNTGSTTDFHSVKFINKNTGWICGTGVIAKTTNAGLNWVQQTHPATNKRLNCLSVIDSNTLYCVGMFKTILKTTNGGINWNAIENGPYGTGDSYKVSFFINKNTGWVSGSGQKLWKTTNGGDSLIQIYIADWVNDIYFKDSMTGIVCGDGGFLQKTTNGGLNWITPNIQLHYVGYTFQKLSVINNQYVWITGTSGPVYRSTDFGNNWDSVGYVIDNFNALYAIRFININNGWAGGGGVDQGRLFKTTNSGYTWVRQLNLTIPGYIGDIYFQNDSTGWATGSNGMVLYTANGGVTSVKQIYTETTKSFELHQNYPNPFNPTTTIRFQIANGFPIGTFGNDKGGVNVVLKVFDVMGREVQTLVNESLKPGTYEVKFDGSKISSGVYFYKLYYSNSVQTKKLSLIK